MGFKETYEAIPKTEYMKRFQAIWAEALSQEKRTPPANPSDVIFLDQQINKLYLECVSNGSDRNESSYSPEAEELISLTSEKGQIFNHIREVMRGKAQIAREQLKAAQTDPEKAAEEKPKPEKKPAAIWYHGEIRQFSIDFEKLKEEKKTLKLTDDAYQARLEALQIAASKKLFSLETEGKKIDLSNEKALVESIKAEYPSEKAKKNYVDNKRGKLLDRADDWKDVPLIGRFFKWRLERNDKKYEIDTKTFSTDTIIKVDVKEENLGSGDTVFADRLEDVENKATKLSTAPTDPTVATKAGPMQEAHTEKKKEEAQAGRDRAETKFENASETKPEKPTSGIPPSSGRRKWGK